MLNDVKRLQVQILHGAQLSERKIARETGVSRSSVQRIVQEEPVVPVDGFTAS